MKRALHLIFILFISVNCYTQNDFAIETWREHLPFNNTFSVAKLESQIFAASSYGIFYVDLDDNTLNRLTRVNGLNDFNITAFDVNENTKQLIIGYANGNLDLVDENGLVYNINGIKESAVIGQKAINEIYCDDEFAYLACGFGIVKLDTKKLEIADTYIFGDGNAPIFVHDVTIKNDSIYTSAIDGLYRANKNNPFLTDYNSWEKFRDAPQTEIYSKIDFIDDKFILLKTGPNFSDDSCFFFTSSFTDLDSLYDDDFYNIFIKDGNIGICKNYAAIAFDNNLEEEQTIFSYGSEITCSPGDAIYFNDNFWIADRANGLFKAPNSFSSTRYSIPGPFTDNVFRLEASEGDLWVATGFVDGSAWNNTFNSNGALNFNTENWSAYNRFNVPEMATDSLFDYVHVAINPKDSEHVYVSSFYGGLLEFKDGEFVKRYTYYNSAMDTSFNHPNKQVKSSVATVDNNEQVWVGNSFTANPLVLIMPDQNSYRFNLGANGTNQLVTDILHSSFNNYIYVAIRGKGLVVYDYGTSPTDASDDTYKYLIDQEGLGNLPSKNVNTLAEDKDGNLWIGTNSGPVVLSSPGSVFSNGDFDAQKVSINVNGSIQFLLDEQVVTSIKVDAANRKWIGTVGGGLFLMSEDGTEEVYNFNTENSPILSNTIISLAILDETGEVFIGTDKGIIGFKSTATKAEINYNDIYAYPNPVRPEYQGPIAFKGLITESEFFITDAFGNLVTSGESFGGQAIWDGKTATGEKVASGVYYFFVSDANGNSKKASKVLFLR